MARCTTRGSTTGGVRLLGLALAIVAAGTAAAAPPDAAATEALFERFKSLAGQWQGKSSRGWTDRSTVKTIAAGSAVMWESFDAHPGEEMVTLLHRDGERLLLTHYCVAKNQPRLRLTRVSEGGTVAEFTFLDATGMPDRNRGHMDSVVLRFQDDDRFTSRWTWYEDGESRWMEEIHCTRVR